MSRALNDLDERFKPLAIELLARLAEARIPILIVDTLRTQAEHEINLANGTSWTNHSKHLDGLAIDIVSFEEYKLYGPDKLEWNNDAPVWQKIGKIGKSINPKIKWGGDWQQKDMGHFELDISV
jgi:hypothetical protein